METNRKSNPGAIADYFRKNAGSNIGRYNKTNVMSGVFLDGFPEYKESVAQTIKDQQESIAKLAVVIKNAKEEIDSLVKDMSDSRQESSKKIEELEEKIEEEIDNAKSYQLKIIETLGIFVALFTFISVEFQILRGISNLEQAVALSLVLLGSLGMFLSLLSYCVGRFFYENSFRLVVFLMSMLLLVVGVFMVAYPFNQDTKSKKMNFNSSYSENRR